MAQPPQSVPSFVRPEDSPHLASEGHATLEWQLEGADDSFRYELVQSTETDFESFRTRYQGLDRASYISGLPAGDFYYRVRAYSPGNDTPSPWSETLHVKVEYVSFTWVIWLSVTGLIVLTSTVATVCVGHRRALRHDSVEL